MIKVKLKQILEAKEALLSLSNQKGNAKIAYLIMGILKKCNEEIASFEKVRNDKIMEFGEKGENNIYTVKNENLEPFLAQMNELADVEIEIKSDPISVDKIENFNLTPNELLLLNGWLIFNP